MSMRLRIAVVAVLAAALAGGAAIARPTAAPTPRQPGIGEEVRTTDGWGVTVLAVLDVEAQAGNPYYHVAGRHYWVATLLLDNRTGYRYLTGGGIRMVGSDDVVYDGAPVAQYHGSLNADLKDGGMASGNVT